MVWQPRHALSSCAAVPAPRSPCSQPRNQRGGCTRSRCGAAHGRGPPDQVRPHLFAVRDARHRPDAVVPRRRALFAIPALGVLVLGTAVDCDLRASVGRERSATSREAMASAAILSAALEQPRRSRRSIRSTRSAHASSNTSSRKPRIVSISPARLRKASCRATPWCSHRSSTSTAFWFQTRAEQNPKQIDLSDRDHFKVHERENDDNLYISKPVLGRVSGQWTLQMSAPAQSP